jgi:hypothetical protein
MRFEVNVSLDQAIGQLVSTERVCLIDISELKDLTLIKSKPAERGPIASASSSSFSKNEPRSLSQVISYEKVR